MNNFTLPIYLYFLNRNDGKEGMFFDELLHFYRFVNLKGFFRWERIFIFDDFFVKDMDCQSVFSTLAFHDLIEQNYTLTSAGIDYLESILNEHLTLRSSIENFIEEYKGECATKGTCFMNVENFTIACHNCKERTCAKTSVSLLDWKRIIFPERILKFPCRSLPIS